MGDIEKSINNQDYKKAKIQIISLQVYMNNNTNFKKTFKKMKSRILTTRVMIYNILNSDIVTKDSKIYATLQRIIHMSDRNLMINYYNIFEKGELVSFLKSLVNASDYKKNNYYTDKETIYSLSDDVENAFYSNIKSKFSTMDEETIFRSSDNIMIKSGENKYKYIEGLLDTIDIIKQSNNNKLAKLKESIQYLNIDKIKYELESKNKEEINEFVRDIFIKDRNTDELTEILSLRYKNIIESGIDITFEEFMKGDFENDKEFNR